MRKQKFSFLGENFGDLSPSGNAFDIHAFTQHTLSSSQIRHPFLYHLILGVKTKDCVGFKLKKLEKGHVKMSEYICTNIPSRGNFIKYSFSFLLDFTF